MSAPEWTLSTALERAQKQQQEQQPGPAQVCCVWNSCELCSDFCSFLDTISHHFLPQSCAQLLRHLGLVQYLRSAAAAPSLADTAAAASQQGRQLQQLLDGAVPAVDEWQPDMVAGAMTNRVVPPS